ncbi:MAG TPA: S8 family serine peptidase [Actinomycetota bacterium]|nr:S8 family serine peptidase [Actinomycetota bacterium]
MRTRMVVAALAALVAGGLLAAVPASAEGAAKVSEYVVQYREGVSAADARAAIRSLGGRVVDELDGIGVAKVRTRNADFEAGVLASDQLAGATINRVIGYAEPALREKVDDVESLIEAQGVAPEAEAASDEEPLAGLQWDMQMIHATAAESYSVATGNHDVLVGIIDTGIDASHPDLAPNFNADLSRNFTTDIPLIDGPCNQEPDHSCEDPADVDEGGHGSHVAGTVGAALNSLGIAGVAPDVSLVNLRAGQDSGFFFLFESLAALTYAADNGIDVVNMSFFTDPWLFNCRDNPLDTPAEQAEQATVIDSTNAALDYAHAHGVTLIAAEGNEHTDLGNPTDDAISPDFPPGSEKVRDNIDNDCLIIPTEGNHVLSVSALGSTGRKAYYSNYGLEQTVVSAPGGDRREFFGTPQYNTAGLRVLSTYPADLAIEEKLITGNFKPRTPLAVVDCGGGQPSKSTCGVYVYLQGTSMASPHAVGVAALIVQAIGSGAGADFGADPDKVEAALRRTATDADVFFTDFSGDDWRDFCPEPPTLFHYDDTTLPVDPPDWDALCEGNARVNGFYGDGVVDALAAANL